MAYLVKHIEFDFIEKYAEKRAPALEYAINRYAEDGWEMVSVAPEGRGWLVVMRRDGR